MIRLIPKQSQGVRFSHRAFLLSRPLAAALLVTAFWATCLVFGVFWFPADILAAAQIDLSDLAATNQAAPDVIESATNTTNATNAAGSLQLQNPISITIVAKSTA